jgi:biotin carboxylase
MHVRIADESVCIGPNPVNKSYLNTHSIISACEITKLKLFIQDMDSYLKMLDLQKHFKIII